MLRLSSVPDRVRSFAFVAPLLSLAAHAAVVGVAVLHAGGGEPALAASTRVESFEVPAPDLIPQPLAEPQEAKPAARLRQDPQRSSAPVSVHDASTADTSAAPVLATAPVLVAAPTAEATPRFVVALPATTPANGALVNAAVGPSGHSNEQPISANQADTPAKLLAGSPPAYTAAAQEAGVEADVALEIVVGASGLVQSARSTVRVGYGLDDAALTAVKGYRFSPARLAGRAIAVRMRWLMRFQLR